MYIYTCSPVISHSVHRISIFKQSCCICRLVLLANLLVCYQRISYQSAPFEILLMHINLWYLVVIIAIVVLHSGPCVIAGRVDGYFIFVISQITKSTLLSNGSKDMEKLTNTGHLIFCWQRIHFCERDSDEPGLWRQISRKAHSAHSPAVYIKLKAWTESVIRGAGSQVPVIV